MLGWVVEDRLFQTTNLTVSLNVLHHTVQFTARTIKPVLLTRVIVSRMFDVTFDTFFVADINHVFKFAFFAV
jgi:hypothetical protein